MIKKRRPPRYEISTTPLIPLPVDKNYNSRLRSGSKQLHNERILSLINAASTIESASTIIVQKEVTPSQTLNEQTIILHTHDDPIMIIDFEVEKTKINGFNWVFDKKLKIWFLSDQNQDDQIAFDDYHTEWKEQKEIEGFTLVVEKETNNISLFEN